MQHRDKVIETLVAMRDEIHEFESPVPDEDSSDAEQHMLADVSDAISGILAHIDELLQAVAESSGDELEIA